MAEFSSSPGAPAFGAHAATGAVRALIGWTRALPRGWLGKRLGFLLRRIAIALLRGRPVDAESLGARFRLFPYNNVCEKRILFSPRDFDEAERALLIGRLTPNFVFLDIGANIGGYSLALAAAAGPGARILAIEPQPEIFERLVYNIRANPFGTVKALALAVADRDGEITLFLDSRNKGEASVKIVSADHARQVKVPARALLGILEDEGFDHVDAMKLDVEGAEDLILQRFFAEAPQALWPRLIIVERGEGRWSIDLLALLEAQGYRRLAATRNNHILERGA
ncbi:MAG: FkbM family methyltransferase [Hyphomicrobiales bacterium]|uniref:FkbM family methyltransferase n=1 Tax=Rhabdaerophilum calidifontis TaxID=2604328 RepID=UPI00123A9179|nr:FkbM family methyltransferase [Rhabdaerophilum calidifontis]MCA1953175.1 FkbM family methyltransferase [Hyphomicrobiales bacterium]MCA1999892.1 FkbM family methyltransferase [Hyphomicrobiales bacterium]